ncbi:efflux RND transporter periplasmic adaptor subunit [Shewanella sp. GXUN23E]|uniref:efflux RND transporter periplasmic adaptor subunit n=1 Tax=Shewanella sp. GXUN23E TaxID=3422498 RepID=UPI003D7E1CCE
MKPTTAVRKHHSATATASACLLGLSLAFSPAYAAAGQTAEHSEHQTSQIEAAQSHYYCPMHPQETSDHPGRCPICKMFLVKDEEQEEETHSAQQHAGNDHSAHQSMSNQAADKVFNHPQPDPLAKASAAPASEGKIKYVCPMHPQIVSDEQGTCPICGMNLEPVTMAADAQEIEINVSGGMQQALALRTEPVKRGTMWKYVRTVGQVDYDESQIEHVHARVSGWIEKLQVSAAGDKIEKGQLLYELYSPELVNAQDDYLLAMETLKQSKNSQSYQELVRKAGLRLELLGMSQAQITKLAKTGKSQYRVPFYAKSNGVVKTLSIRDGMYIQPQTEILSMVDLSKVWVIADVFENEQSWLEIGQEAEVSVPAMGLQDIKGRVDYIYPELDPVTRSLRVRIVLDNPGAELRPKTLAKVALFGGAKRQALTIPQEALIQTGKENRVIVKLSDDTFTARLVDVGMQSKGKAEILKGLEEDELVVTSGQFLLDSEASLKGSLMRLSSGHQH